ADDDQAEKTPEATFELAGAAVIVHTADVEQTVRVGCTPASFTSRSTTAYVLCAPNVVVVIDALPKPHVLQRRALAQHIVSLSVKDDVVMARTDAGLKPLDEIPPSTAPALVVVSERSRPYEYESHPRKKTPPKPQVTGLELALLGTAGVGVDATPGAFTFFDASIVQRFPFGMSLAAFGNFGAGTGSFDPGSRSTGPFGGDVQAASFEAHIGLDMRWFALSFGFGAGMREQGYDVEPVFAIRGRGGEIDGFTFTWHSSFVIHGPNAFGVLGAMLEFPLARTWWLGADAELGNLRYGRFMVDLRHRLAGTGPHGTFDVRVSAGLAYLQTSAADSSNMEPCGNTAFFNGGPLSDTECLGTNADYLGPAVSLGFVWRP
ncbi:MAG TPA: hypothetical protein VGH87_14985, partial [Polyangiaceae bacterium]